MEKKFNYLYKTTCKENGKIYVGVHSCDDLSKDSYIGSGLRLRRSLKKYGVESFEKEILQQFSSADEAFEKEREIVNEEFLKRSDVYNLSLGGRGGVGPALCKTRESHLESVAKAAKSRRGKKTPKQSLKMKGRNKENDDGMKKMSEVRKTLLGEKSSNWKLTDAERSQLMNLYHIGSYSWEDLQRIFPQMTIAGIKSAVYSQKRKATK